jgi:hypothetical protein
LGRTFSCMCYMHWLSYPCHCLDHAVRNPPFLILSLGTCVAFFVIDPCFVCDSLSSEGSNFIWANNKMSYLFSRHDPGLLDLPSLGEKEHPLVCCTFWGKRLPLLGGGSFFLAWFGKQTFSYFLMLGGSNYFRACHQGFTLIDYANLNSFTIDSSVPKVWDCK